MPGKKDVYMISEEISALLKNISIYTLIKNIFEESGYPVVTRKLLLIRQKLPRKKMDGYWVKDWSEVTYDAAELVKAKAISEGWDVDDLGGNNATKLNILNSIQNDPDFILWYGHCCGIPCSSNLCGQVNDQPVPAISAQLGNVSLLSGRTVSANCCYTLKGVGKDAIKANAVAYLGYKLALGFVTGALPLASIYKEIEDDFIEGANAPIITLLEGSTYEVALKKGWDMWNQKYWKWVKKCTPPPGQSLTPLGKLVCGDLLPAFLDNRGGIDRLGEAKVVARPIGILLPTP